MPVPGKSNINVFFSADSFHEDELRDKAVVVIDVLRATSTIVAALMNGARGVIPVEDMEEAGKISQNVDSDNYLLCGEKDGVKIQGYELGNSPLEYTPEIVNNKTLIFNTTNGTKAIKKSLGSASVYVASFLNVSTVVEALRVEQNDIVLICAGWKGRLSLEDMLLAGNIIHSLYNGQLSDNANDGAKVAITLFEKFGSDIASTIHHSSHAVRLKNIIGDEDIDYCCQTDICNLLPLLNDGIITVKNG